MIWIILGVSILVILLGAIMFIVDDGWEGGLFAGGVSCISLGAAALLASTVAAFCLVNENLELQTVDERIAMYEEENAKIEERIDGVVKGYQEYEGETFESLAPDADAMTMIYLYPELKSDALVQEQISLYVSNVEKIKELKEEKISGRVTRWWLYFGE